jgi:hypothetical protein
MTAELGRPRDILEQVDDLLSTPPADPSRPFGWPDVLLWVIVVLMCVTAICGSLQRW